MGSIFDLFNVDPEAAAQEGLSEPAFDGSNLDSVLEEVLNNRPVAGRPAGFDPSRDGGATSPAPSPDGEVHGAEGGAAPVSDAPETPAPAPVAETPPPAAPPAPAAPAAGPLADLSDMELLELAQLRQALNDPERAMGVRRAMLGVEAPPAPTQPAAAAPTPPPAPTLPEEFEEGTPEAQLWHDNQALRTRLDELAAGQATQQQQTEQEQMNAAAQRATAGFVSRYGHVLSAAEIQAVAQHAGIQKLPEAFRPVSSSWDEAMTKSLDYVVRSNDALLAKVLGAPAPPPPPPAAGAPGDPARDATRRRLTALSSAASPSGDTPTRTPIQHRPDGKLTETSRLALVQEMMNGGITGSPGEGI